MLVLSRKKNEKLIIGDGLIEITIVDIRNNKVRLGIDSPKDISINREEIHKKIQKENDDNKHKVHQHN